MRKIIISFCILFAAYYLLYSQFESRTLYC